MERDSSSGGRKYEARGLVQFTSVSFILLAALSFVFCCTSFSLSLSLCPLTHSISDIVACLEFVYEKPLAVGISKHIESEGERVREQASECCQPAPIGILEGKARAANMTESSPQGT